MPEKSAEMEALNNLPDGLQPTAIAPLFPTSVRVGYRTYRIEDWAPKSAAAAHRYGEASHGEAVLRVDLSYGPVEAANTLLHELLHAIAHTNHAEDLFGAEERAVQGLTGGLTQIMRDNPPVRDWLTWAWAQEDY